MLNRLQSVTPIRSLAIVLYFLWAGSAASAYGSEGLPLDAKARQSDLVIVGRVVRLHVRSSRSVGIEVRTADVVVKATLKGASQETIEVLYRSPIDEYAPDCCEVGKSYVFFLKKMPNGQFESSDSSYGIYPIL